MDAIVDAIGSSAAISLIHIYGGSRLFIPMRKRMTEDHPIAGLIGLPLALRLADAFGGEAVPLPIGDRVLASAREAQIIEAWNNGESAAEIGRRFLVVERTVRKLIGRARAAGMSITDRAKAKKA